MKRKSSGYAKADARQAAIYLREHADVLMRMPASEQMIGARDAVLFSALNQIADALDELRSSSPPRRGDERKPR